MARLHACSGSRFTPIGQRAGERLHALLSKRNTREHMVHRHCGDHPHAREPGALIP